MRLVWLVVKNPLRTDRCRRGSVYHNTGLWQLEISRRLQFCSAGNQSNRPRCDKLPRALYRFVFKLPWFILLRRFRRRHWYYVAQVKASSFSDSFWNHASWSQKEETFSSSTSTSALDSLVMEVSESRPFSSNFVRLALVVVCLSA